MIGYPDASFLVSLYVWRAETSIVRDYLATIKEPLAVSSVLRFEFANALRLAAYRKTMPVQVVVSALAEFDADAETGRIVIPPVPWERVHAEAERLSNAHTLRAGHRSFDILHVATALTLGAKEFLTFDSQQAQLATAAGLKVKP